HGLLRLKRHHRGDHPRAQPLDIVAMANDGNRKRRAADGLNQQGQFDHLPYSAWDLEIAFEVNNREAVPVAGNELGVIEAELLPIPIFDQPVEHIEVMREIDDAGRIAMRKTNWNAARESPAGWRKSILEHVTKILSQGTRAARERALAVLTAGRALKFPVRRPAPLPTNGQS